MYYLILRNPPRSLFVIGAIGGSISLIETLTVASHDATDEQLAEQGGLRLRPVSISAEEYAAQLAAYRRYALSDVQPSPPSGVKR